ncbi:TPA: hypothetical protein N0F65_003950 [Lagenidium giganteum]|nr:TPA: hypothetical protein N0F65_003950 [Lagenidium giganteum]
MNAQLKPDAQPIRARGASIRNSNVSSSRNSLVNSRPTG